MCAKDSRLLLPFEDPSKALDFESSFNLYVRCIFFLLLFIVVERLWKSRINFLSAAVLSTLHEHGEAKLEEAKRQTLTIFFKVLLCPNADIAAYVMEPLKNIVASLPDASFIEVYFLEVIWVKQGSF
jgi:hypothetical protein